MVPAAHAVQALAPAAAYVPAAQLPQLAAPALELVPAEQDVHVEAPPGEDWPALQATQVRSLVAVPEAVTPEPAAHEVHFVQLWLFSAALKEPAAQPLQVRSVVADPELVTYWPAEHVRLATHGVAELASSSHVDAMHATLGLLLPAQ